jgi:hypothetical protein
VAMTTGNVTSHFILVVCDQNEGVGEQGSESTDRGSISDVLLRARQVWSATRDCNQLRPLIHKLAELVKGDQ